MRLEINNDPCPHFSLGGKPFRMQADTAWELFHRLTKAETLEYLETRARQGFTALMAVGLAELDGVGTASAEGHLPLVHRDPRQLNPAYWEHAAWTVDRAIERGLHVGILPSWGCWWNPKWAKTEVIFTPESAAEFGRKIGQIFARKGVFWVIGGDRPLASPMDAEILHKMATAIKGEDPTGIFSLHPMGSMSSADIIGDPEWLDFHMIQSGHSHINEGFHRRMAQNPSAKPIVDAEPCYENHPISFDAKNGWFSELDVRRRILQGLIAGGIGAFYGCHDVWQMHKPGIHEAVTHARSDWRSSLNLPGAEHLAKAMLCFEGLVWQKAEPFGHTDRGPLSAVALPLAGEGARLAYLPSTKAVRISRRAEQIRWIEPETGASWAAEAGSPLICPPYGDHDRDWLLRLECT